MKKTLDEQTARMKAIKRLYDSSAAFQSLKPVYDGLQKIKFEKPRAKYKAEHEAELIQFYAARRKLTGEFPDGKVDMKKLSDEYDELEQAHETTYGEFKAVRDDLHRLWKVDVYKRQLPPFATFLKSVSIWDTPSISRPESTSRTKKAIMSWRTNGQFSRIPMSLSLIHI